MIAIAVLLCVLEPAVFYDEPEFSRSFLGEPVFFVRGAFAFKNICVLNDHEKSEWELSYLYKSDLIGRKTPIHVIALVSKNFKNGVLVGSNTLFRDGHRHRLPPFFFEWERLGNPETLDS